MKAIYFLTPLALCALAEANAQPLLVSSPDRSGEARAQAVISAQVSRIVSLTEQADALAAEIAKREACEATGRLYLPGHAAANGQGCVHPDSF